MSEQASANTSAARRRRVAAGAALAVLLAGSGGAASALMSAPTGSTTCTNSPTVEVSVPQEMYNTVFATAQDLSNHNVVCASYDVRAVDSSDTAAAVKSGSQVPDVWISDSSMWVDDVSDKLGDGWVQQRGAIATSPLLFGVPQALKGDESAYSKNWASALSTDKKLSLQPVDDSSTAYVALEAANRNDIDHDERTTLLRAVVRLSRTTMSDTTLATKATQGPTTARDYVLSEQQFIDYNKSHPDKKLSPVVPQQGAAQLDYPFVVPVQAKGSDTEAINALYAALRSAKVRGQLRGLGFRVDGESAPEGAAVPQGTHLLDVPAKKDAINAIRAWGDLAKDARMLVLIDVSGSMNTEVSKGVSRIKLLSDTAIGALNALPGTTQLGAWVFSTDLQGKGKDWMSISDGIQTIGHTPAGDKYRNELIGKAKTVPMDLAKRGGDTALYDSIWAAYQYSSQTYDPGYVNSVVVLTDGKNDDPNGGLSLPQLLSRIKGRYNPKKPVKIVTIAIGGGDADPKALTAIADASGGLFYKTQKAQDISNVFVDAFLHRG